MVKLARTTTTTTTNLERNRKVPAMVLSLYTGPTTQWIWKESAFTGLEKNGAWKNSSRPAMMIPLSPFLSHTKAQFINMIGIRDVVAQTQNRELELRVKFGEIGIHMPLSSKIA